ncbi:MAG: hypothetical protein QM487_00265 [Candidatus Marithrix sp.]
MNELTLLLCGKHEHLGELSQILEQLGNTIDNFTPRCFKFISENNSSDITTFGPYCGRTILETACSILISRIDPFRVLLVKRNQEQPNYNPAIRHKIAIQWSGDVITDQKPLPLEKLTYDKVSRALLTDHIAQIYWGPAFTYLIDNIRDSNESEWLNELTQLDLRNESNIVDYFRTEANELYSSLSKGIHQEFVIPQISIYDNETIKILLLRTICLVTKMALVSHCIPTISANIDLNVCLGYSKKIEEQVRL